MAEWEITVEQLKEQMGGAAKPVLLDVREPQEVAICTFEGALHIPMRELPSRIDELPDPENPLIVYCHHGIRSMSVVSWLREAGWAGAVSLRGGIDLWAVQYDPKMPRY